MRKTDEQIAREYCDLMEIDLANTPDWYFSWLVRIIGQARKAEPRINSGVHIVDWIGICDEDDDFDSFYGPDYFQHVEQMLQGEEDVSADNYQNCTAEGQERQGRSDQIGSDRGGG